MAFKVQVGPPQIATHQGQTVLVTDPDGSITWPSERGLYFLDTRVISHWAIYANGEPWELLNGGPVKYHDARIFLTNRSILTEDGVIAPRTVGLTISRSISGGLHEDLDITNNSMKPVRFQLEVAPRCDFADIFEVKSGHIVRRGQITTEWSQRRQRLQTVGQLAGGVDQRVELVHAGALDVEQRDVLDRPLGLTNELVLAGAWPVLGRVVGAVDVVGVGGERHQIARSRPSQ